MRVPAREQHLTDLRVLSRTRGAVNKTRPWLVLTMAGDGRTRFEDNPARETVSPGQRERVTPGVRIGWVQEIQLKSLILAQPERWRRG